MADIFASMNLSASGMKAQATRLRHVSENIANADTPGYRRKTVSFEEAFGTENLPEGAVKTGPLHLDQTALERIHDPAHPLADASGYYEGSNVDLVIEIADAREARRSYDANMSMFDQARQMNASLLELLKR